MESGDRFVLILVGATVAVALFCGRIAFNAIMGAMKSHEEACARRWERNWNKHEQHDERFSKLEKK